MMTDADQLAAIQAADKVILFDGVCKLCHAWGRFIIRFDKTQKIKLAAVQSDEGLALMAYYQLNQANTQQGQYDTMYYLTQGQVYEKSTAFLAIMATIPYPWRLLCVFKIVPRFIRDWVYDYIACRRYQLFGKYTQCTLPSPDHDNRFLNFNRATLKP
jgi:predicted DCC family thiol-disulfide oxidoreductase YuxK